MGEVPFPNEIWMEIFKNIDRRKLMELRLVCHRFYDLIEYHLNKDTGWKQLVDDAISFECMTRTMQRAHPYHFVRFWSEITDPVMWRGTYLSYKKWQKVIVNPETKDTIVPGSTLGEISCACTFDGQVLVVTVGENCVLRFWDLQNKVKISTKGLFANSISCGECRHFCIGDMNGILTSYERVDNHIIAGPTIDFKLWEGERLIAHTLDGKNMVALGYMQNGTAIYLYQGKIEGGKLTRFTIDQIKNYIRLPPDLDASMYRLVMTTITYFFGVGETSIGSTNYYEDEWHEYYLIQHFGCQVRTVALHAQILMFGLEDGSVHLLYIKHYGDVMDLEETIKKARKIQVDDVPILDITILEVDKKPCIVVITEQKVHLLNFF